MTMMTMMMSMNNGNYVQKMGVDTTLTKVFVGGLAWETPKEALRDHFQNYGHILEAVIISDKLTGRSKGYGFVTFTDAEAAKNACEDPTPIINGRRANCNLAALGARRPRTSNTTTNPQQGVTNNVGPRAATSSPAPASAPKNPVVQWYYPAASHFHQPVPFYGYSPSYIATPDINYNHHHKLGYTNGSYMNGHYGQVYPGQAMMPMYPLYHFHQSQAMGLAAHMYSHTPAAPMHPIPPLISKPTSIAPPPNAVCLAVE
ncbi:hypothetical protein ACJIZ3_022948 [Penstemon smallii]|uniref:RRM domain-containing protein n=1 Tax=Penstemon smallii TaxID=265156 RepID=A0ABD3TPS6_9LAMI